MLSVALAIRTQFRDPRFGGFEHIFFYACSFWQTATNSVRLTRLNGMNLVLEANPCIDSTGAEILFGPQ